MHAGMSIALALTLTVGGQTVAAAGQTVADVRQLYDAGKYREALEAIDEAAGESDKASRLQYLAAQSHDKLNDEEAARRMYQRLADLDEDNAWTSIGQSAVRLMDKEVDDALASADKAVRLAGSLPEAHYQRGIVLMTRKDYGQAMASFTRAAELDRAFAAAHYYAGLASYRAKRIDLMTKHFETFVKLAPNAPERPEVESILRTVRGR